MTTHEKGLEPLKGFGNTPLCVAYGRSGVGGRRENQDSLAGTTIGDNMLVTVCDGMGGMNGGQTASRIAVSEILQTVIETPASRLDGEAVRLSVEAANRAICRKSASEPRLRGMGTTATVLLITPEAAYVTYIGDSRVYQLRNGAKVFRTYDHSKVFDMVSQNLITEEQARTSSFSNIITKALGIRPQVDVVVEKLPYRKGDRFVLCSDGVWNCRPEPEIMKLMTAGVKPDEAVMMLTETVNGYGYAEGGEHDNLTAVVVDVKCNSTYQYSMFRPLSNMIKGLFRN